MHFSIRTIILEGRFKVLPTLGSSRGMYSEVILNKYQMLAKCSPTLEVVVHGVYALGA